MELFYDLGHYKSTTHFGTYRVDLLTLLFARVVDLHNIECVFRKLTPFEYGCAIARIGYLSVYNPMKPEGHWELDLARREERVMCKTLCLLATNEPGNNLPMNSFRWQREAEALPGYELTEPWLTEEGFPCRGVWAAQYYAGEGTNEKGCKPHIKLRKAMLHLVLLREEEIVEETMRDKQVTLINALGRTVGHQYIETGENKLKFTNYLAYHEDISTVRVPKRLY